MATHKCPGCGAVSVTDTKLACRPCWFRLPKDLQRKIYAAYQTNHRAHAQLVREAIEWYRQNPRPSSPPTSVPGSGAPATT